MRELILDTKQGDLIISAIDKDGEIEFGTLHDTRWINKEQAKELIEFLQKQIEA